jgi:NAD(P)-dependent dehydrogenase (short-subunit alcohol dehydrogenase family)
MKLNLLFLSLLLSYTQGWSVTPKADHSSNNGVSRKDFFVGAASAVVAGGMATAAGAVSFPIATTTTTNKSGPYEPAPNSLKDQVILITGATTGLGLESAKRLAAAGATVVLTSRTVAKGEKALQNVQEYLTQRGVNENAKIFNVILDLDDLASVRAFPDSFKKLGLGKINVLMNNAGVMAVPERQLTKDGYERTFQSNHLGHFVLTAELYPLLSREKATIINVSSEAYMFAAKQGMDLDNLNGEVQYGPWSSYGLSKLANILFTQELQRRADSIGDTWLTTVALHPGAVATELQRNFIGLDKWEAMKTSGPPSPFESFTSNALSAFLKTLEEGASTQVYLAAGAGGNLKKGGYYSNMMPKNVPAFASDTVAAKALWEKSEELGGIKFNL